MNIDIASLKTMHRYASGRIKSVLWALTDKGIDIEGVGVLDTGPPPATVLRIWTQHRDAIMSAADRCQVPVELIIATAATESRGNPNAVRHEPGYISDEETPHRVSPGMMQTLISTARATLKGVVPAQDIDRKWLLVPANSILAGTSYIAEQRPITAFDPPKVACAYNAGSIYPQDGRGNRWKMRQYPIGTGEHADRFVRWFNDCFSMWHETPAPDLSFLAAMARGQAAGV